MLTPVITKTFLIFYLGMPFSPTAYDSLVSCEKKMVDIIVYEYMHTDEVLPTLLKQYQCRSVEQ